MSITDELREWARNRVAEFSIGGVSGNDLIAIADRIDAAHERMYYDLTIGMEPMDEEHMARDGWVKLPVDADGVPIRVGDELTNGADLPAKVRGMVLDESGWTVSTRELRGYGVLPATLRHVQPDSWVRIIGDAMSFEGDGWYSTRDDAMAELVERCRRLAGEDA